MWKMRANVGDRVQLILGDGALVEGVVLEIYIHYELRTESPGLDLCDVVYDGFARPGFFFWREWESGGEVVGVNGILKKDIGDDPALIRQYNEMKRLECRRAMREDDLKRRRDRKIGLELMVWVEGASEPLEYVIDSEVSQERIAAALALIGQVADEHFVGKEAIMEEINNLIYLKDGVDMREIEDGDN